MKTLERGLVETSVGYVHYRATRSGRPLVLMHVNGGSSRSYLELLEALPDDVRAIAIDYPGCGGSDHFDHQPTIAEYAQIVAEVMGEMGIKKATFMGQAGGCYVATELAVSFPDLVDRIILMCCPWYPSKEAQTAAHSGLASVHSANDNGFPMPLTLADRIGLDPEHCPVYPTQLWADRRNVEAIEAGRDRGQLLAAFAVYDLPANLARVEHPVMNLWGEHFRYAKYNDEFARLAKHHTTAIIPDARIDPQFDHPNEVSREVVAFMDQN